MLERPLRARSSVTSSLRSQRTTTELMWPLIKRGMKGKLPPFNDWHNTVVDDEQGFLYLYGGCPPKTDTPCSDFYRCEMETMMWEDLTNQVVHKVTPGDPFSAYVYKPLPARQKPIAVFIQLNLRNYMFIYGGYDSHTDTVKGDLIAVDLDHLMWWFVAIDPGVPRFAACMVAVDQSLYIFGGCRDSAQGEGEEDLDIIRSFSVVEYVTETGTWNWKIPERAYDIDLGYDFGGIAVFEGQKILLLAGRNDDKEALELSKERFFLFHTQHLTFQVEDKATGNFPPPCKWYKLWSPPRYMAQSALLCVWIPSRINCKYLVPEIYRYLLPPIEECECLDLQDKIWNTDLDLQNFVVVKGKVYLMGFDGDEARERAVWNVAVEVQIDDTQP